MWLNTVMLHMKLNLIPSKTKTAKHILKLTVTHSCKTSMFHYEAFKLYKKSTSAWHCSREALRRSRWKKRAHVDPHLCVVTNQHSFTKWLLPVGSALLRKERQLSTVKKAVGNRDFSGKSRQTHSCMFAERPDSRTMWLANGGDIQSRCLGHNMQTRFKIIFLGGVRVLPRHFLQEEWSSKPRQGK